MKVFEYEYFINYGSGAGIVIAGSKSSAMRMIKERFDDESLDELILTEVDLSVPRLIDHSYNE